MTPFKPLSRESFEAYAPEKWSSNVHNLVRMRVKDNLIALCDAGSRTLSNELQGLDRATSDEVPNLVNHKKVDAQWVYWFRNAAQRESLATFLKKTPLDVETIFNIAPQDKHATLAVVLDQKKLWIGLRIAAGASVDRRNLAAKLGKDDSRGRLAELLAELPQGAELGLRSSLRPTVEIDSAGLEGFAGSLATSSEEWLVGHTVSAEDVLAFGADLPDHVGRWLGTLLPLYRFAAWSPDNDQIEAGKQIKEEKAQELRRSIAFSIGDKVRILGGMFRGKVGVVESIDAKAKVKVRVGTMTVVLAGAELTAVS